MDLVGASCESKVCGGSHEDVRLRDGGNDWMPERTAANDLAQTGTLRAVYLGTNAAQAMRDPSTGEIRGRPMNSRVSSLAATTCRSSLSRSGPPAVIDAVKNGEADIGFVAYEATDSSPWTFPDVHAGAPEFPGSGRFNYQIGWPRSTAWRKDRRYRERSITLCMKRILKQATLMELENNPTDEQGADRARDRCARCESPASDHAVEGDTRTRLLPDDLINGPQNIVVPKETPVALAAINALIDDVRASGVLQARSIAAAPSELRLLGWRESRLSGIGGERKSLACSCRKLRFKRIGDAAHRPWLRHDWSDPLNRPRDRRILVQ